MAAPATARAVSLSCRDAKGNVSRIRVTIGDATTAAIETDIANLVTHLNAATNAHWWYPASSPLGDKTYGTAAVYQSVEDKAVLTFKSSLAVLSRFKIAAPKSAAFDTDGETVLSTETNIAAVITDFTTFVYGRASDTSPLAYVGGIRTRVRFQRRFNIMTKNPAETGPGE